MREYRGKSNGDWVYGSLVYSPKENQYYIVEHNGEELSFPVEKETIGQYIGIPDKNGKKIYTGDIGKDRGGNLHVVRYGRFTPKTFYRMFGYDTTISIYGLHTVSDEVECMLPTNHTLEIIGNTIDNPELLKRSEKE